jgi:hypothetical protein
MDPAQNADYAAGLLESNLGRYGGDVRAALSAYNAGSPTATGTRTDWGDGAPVSYADSVFRHYERLGGTTTAAQSPSAAADPRDAAASVDQLRGLAGDLGAGYYPALPALSLPPYRPIPQPDARDRDLAPSIGSGDDAPTD